MEILRQIEPGIALFWRGLAVLAVLWVVAVGVRWRRSGLRTGLDRSVPEGLIGLTLVGVWALTIAPWWAGPSGGRAEINLVPVLPLLSGWGTAEGVRENLPNLIVNPLLYAPLGFGLRWRFGLRLRTIVLIGAGVSVLAETSQALGDQMRTADINDVLLNALGTGLGAWAFGFARRRRPRA